MVLLLAPARQRLSPRAPFAPRVRSRTGCRCNAMLGHGSRVGKGDLELCSKGDLELRRLKPKQGRYSILPQDLLR